MCNISKQLIATPTPATCACHFIPFDKVGYASFKTLPLLVCFNSFRLCQAVHWWMGRHPNFAFLLRLLVLATSYHLTKLGMHPLKLYHFSFGLIPSGYVRQCIGGWDVIQTLHWEKFMAAVRMWHSTTSQKESIVSLDFPEVSPRTLQ